MRSTSFVSLAGAGAASCLVLMFCGLRATATRADDGPAGAISTSTYRIQPGDEIEVQVMNVPELAATLKVRPDGMISVMLLDDVRAAGRSISEVKSELAAGYSKHYRNPRVGVFLKSYVSRVAYVTGEVERPGGVTLTPGLTAMQAVVQAGGLRLTAQTDNVVLLRQVDAGNRKVLPLKLGEVIKGEAPDTLLEASDVVYVPKSDIRVYVGGEVTRPGILPLDGELTALSAVMNAGGFLDSAGAGKAVLIRNKGNRTPMIVSLKLDQVMKGTAADTPLRPFDIIYVPKSTIAKIDKAVDMYIRRVVPFTLTGGFSYILGSNFGGTTPNCFF